MNAMTMDLSNRKRSQGIIFHSDGGSHYASYDFIALLEQHHLRRSMSLL